MKHQRYFPIVVAALLLLAAGAAAAQERVIVWDGEGEDKGGGWVTPQSDKNYIKSQEAESHNGKHALEAHWESAQWQGAGWNWVGWPSPDAATDITGFAKLRFWFKMTGSDRPDSFMVGLNCSSTSKPTKLMNIAGYCKDFADGQWHEVVIPLANILKEKTEFDPTKAWMLEMGVWTEKPKNFSAFVDEIGFEGKAEPSKPTPLKPKASGPQPLPLADPAKYGANIQHTMTLLATSTPQHRHKVRVLFYGQSITEQEWWKSVADDLRKRFPNADLEIQNLALGGFASGVLVRIAEHDLYPFYPDLLILHAYGANNTYEEIIANTRRRTTAEVLMQRDHVTQWPPATPDEKADKGMWWDHMMNNVFLPDYAKKYGSQLADVRGGWLEYLKTNGLEPKDLLKDGVHLNDHGNYLMAELVKRELVYRPDLHADTAKDLVHDVVIGKDARWQNGRLKLDFEGNRVDAIAGGGETGSAHVLIDGKKPSEFAELYVITRPSATQTGYWPALLRVSWEKPLQVEDWTLRVTETNPEATNIKFEVRGSKTGPDGTGISTQRFVSNSGRVVIEPTDWWVKTAYEWTKKPLTAGFEIHWQVKPMFVDSFSPPKVDDPSREYATTLAQGLKNENHTLELIAEGAPPPIQSIRVYRPPVK